jgi:hypothetical protein
MFKIFCLSFFFLGGGGTFFFLNLCRKSCYAFGTQVNTYFRKQVNAVSDVFLDDWSVELGRKLEVDGYGG